MKNFLSIPSSGLLIFGAITLCLCLLGAFSVVHVRGQIAKAAFHTKGLEQELIQLTRKSHAIKTQLADLQQPNFLKMQVAGALNVPSKESIIWAELNSSVDMSSGVKSPKALPISHPFNISLDLAFLNF